jgi:hypothetical protein
MAARPQPSFVGRFTEPHVRQRRGGLLIHVNASLVTPKLKDIKCCIKSVGFLSGFFFGKKPTFRDCLSVPSSGSRGKRGKGCQEVRNMCLYRSRSIIFLVHLETLKMVQRNSHKTLVSYQKTTPGKNLKDFIQLYYRDGNLQSQT